MALTTDETGNLYAATTGWREVPEVLKIDATGQVELVVKEPEHVQSFESIAVGREGNLFVTANRHRILRIDAKGATEVIAGSGKIGSSDDGAPAADADLFVAGVAVDRLSRIWFADWGRKTIRRLDPQ